MLAYDALGAFPTPPGPTPAGYQRFYAEVAASQLRAWLPQSAGRLLDLSGGGGLFGRVAALSGHAVVHVMEPGTEQPPMVAGMAVVEAEPTDLRWVADAAFDAVLAEGRALSHCLATEHTLHDVARILRPGGRLLLCVDSLLAGMARLADQQRWAELADLPAADVVLVPSADGTITRCFWPEELRALLMEAGFDVDWVRPRTVLSIETVERALAADPTQLGPLVRTETALAREREGDAHGVHLVSSACRR